MPDAGGDGVRCAVQLLLLFGEGCGSQFDLTTDGSQLWLAGITAEAKSELFYFTTSYKPVFLGLGGYCDRLANLLFRKPNDGVTELEVPAHPACHPAAWQLRAAL